jgi:hypothetical protein
MFPLKRQASKTDLWSHVSHEKQHTINKLKFYGVSAWILVNRNLGSLNNVIQNIEALPSIKELFF